LFVNKRTSILKKDLITEEQRRISRYAKAMGHPIRMYILSKLTRQSCCFSGDLTDELPIAKSTLSQHLKALREAGLIKGEFELPRIKYCINEENWKEAQHLFQKYLNLKH